MPALSAASDTPNMRRRDGEIDDEVDVVAGQELIDRQRLDAVAAWPGPAPPRADVGAGPQRQAAKAGMF